MTKRQNATVTTVIDTAATTLTTNNYTFITATTVPRGYQLEATRMKVKIGQNIEGKFEINQNTPCACRMSKGRISRIDLGIKLNISENT